MANSDNSSTIGLPQDNSNHIAVTSVGDQHTIDYSKVKTRSVKRAIDGKQVDDQKGEEGGDQIAENESPFDQTPFYQPSENQTSPAPQPTSEDGNANGHCDERISSSYITPDASNPNGIDDTEKYPDDELYDWAIATGEAQSSIQSTEEAEEARIEPVAKPRRFRNMDMSQLLPPKYTRVTKDTSDEAAMGDSMHVSPEDDAYMIPIES